MVHDDILAVVERQRALVALDALAATHTDVSHDDVLGLRGDDATAVDGDALARGGLSGDGDVVKSLVIMQIIFSPFTAPYSILKQIYKEYLGEPNGHKAHELLHTEYSKREKYC